MSDDPEKEIKSLQREVKLLRKKLARSEENRSHAERMKDDTDALYETVLHLVAEQKQAIEEAQDKLKDAFDVITSSITYAARIQRSVLPEPALMRNVAADHFVLWEPRDQVGGDFFWVGAWAGGSLIVLGDCTGHGVPGAFMTLITIGALDRATSEISDGRLGDLVQRVHQLVQTALGQQRDDGFSDDGVELGALFVAPHAPTLRFVGGRFEFFEVSGGEVRVIKGTKKGLGYRGIPFDQDYEEHVLARNVEASYYMTTDGYIDQIGGPKGRMLGKKRFREFLMWVAGLPMAEQKKCLRDLLVAYQGIHKRRDDVSIIGFRF